MIPVYKAEQASGLAEKITASTSIAYTSVLEPYDPTSAFKSKALKLWDEAHAGIRDSDLYFTKSILVSTNWNKNDDVFGRAEVWAARHTASHKPTNLEHDEKRLVGHITDCWAVDDSGKIIAEDSAIDDLPDLFHIVNGAVIYTNWDDKDLVGRTQELLQQIEAGEKFVSMECLFSDFAYALITPEGKFHTLARNEETAFLTKHLRAYGGAGEYDGHKIGRFLKHITFCGKGYVNNPANISSIIFNDASKFSFSTASEKNPFTTESGVLSSYAEEVNSVSNNSEKDIMSDILKDQNTELQSTVKSQAATIDELKEQLAKAGTDHLQNQIDELKQTVASVETERDEALASVDTLTTEKTDLETKLAEANEAKTKLEAEIAESKAEAVKASRISTLVDGGVDKEVAEQKVSLFGDLSDEQFDAVAAEIVANFPKKGDDEDKDKKKDKGKGSSDEEETEAGNKADEEEDEAEASADEEVLENAETDEEAALAAAGEGEGDSLADVRKELSQAFASRMGVKLESDEQADKQE